MRGAGSGRSGAPLRPFSYGTNPRRFAVNHIELQAAGLRGGISLPWAPDAPHPEDWRRRTPWTGPRKLCLAVLEDAVNVLDHAHESASEHWRRLVADTEHWMESGDTQWPFSFINVCNAVGLDSDYLRHGLRVRAARRGPRTKLRTREQVRSVAMPLRRLRLVGDSP